jgi:dihydrolipoamide dehydrogenase
MENTYDIIVIGSGVGGYNAAIRAGQLGLKVACVEKEPVVGGTCLNVGCMPSKALLHASEMFELANTEFTRLGIRVEPGLDLAQMMAQKSESVASLVRGVEYLLKKNNVKRINGRGRLAGPGHVIVEGDGSSVELATRHVVLATGSQPAMLPGVEIDQKRIVDSAGALSLTEVPRRLLVIGGGIIGLELGSIWRRLGAEVQVVEFLDRIVPGSDLEVAKALQRALTKQGIRFRLSTKVAGVHVSNSEVDAKMEPVAGGPAEEVMADVVLVAIGRRPFAQNLGLETVGLELDSRGFINTTEFRTGVDGLWALGDVTHGPMLAHKAEEEAVACIELIAGRAGHVNYDIIPNVIYTRPEVAWVGQTEEEVKASGIAYKVGKFPFMANGRAKINHETEGFVKVISDENYRILGVHMIGPDASELIAEACVAMDFHANSEDIARTCHPHPTRSEALKQASMAVDGWAMQA